MQDILQYLLKLSLALAVVYIFYRLVLRPLTFYQWNRRYLMLYSVVAFFIPFIDINTYVEPQRLQGIRFVKYIPVIHFNSEATAAATTQSNSIDVLLIAGLLIATGSILLLTRLLLQWNSLRRIRRTAVPLYHPEANVYHVDEHVVPFSFGNSIYVNTTLHGQQELQDIILHEFVHVRQKHSFDIILSEVLCILNWYNPFAWFIRHAIRQNLEFIADQSVLNNGLDRKTYQYHLLKVIGSSQYSIANKFNFSSLKKRIAMMNRLKSARVHLVKFVFILPLLAVMLLAFRNRNTEGWYKHSKKDTIPGSTFILPHLNHEKVPLISLKDFYKRNESVKEVAWSDEDEVVVYLKNGKRQVYDSNDEEDMERFAERYGGIPTILPPAFPSDEWMTLPPTAPIEPMLLQDFEVEVPEINLQDLEVPEMDIEVPDVEFEMPDIDIEPQVILDGLDNDVDMDIFQDKELDKFYKRNPNVQAIMWRKDQVIIKKKNGSVETYDMSDEEDMNTFEDKYGEMPTPPPAPPKPPKSPAPPVVVYTPSTKPVETVYWEVEQPKLPDNVRSFEVEDHTLTVRLKNGEKETYDLDNNADQQKLEKKYGKVIMVTDPPRKRKAPRKTVSI